MGWKKLYSSNKSHIVLETHMKIPDMNNRLNFCMNYSENMLAFFTDRFLRGYEDEEGYIHIYSGMLKKVFGNQYKVPLDELVDRGLIYYKWWENAEGKLVRYDPETSECSKIKLNRELFTLIDSEKFRFIPYTVKHRIVKPKRGRWKLKAGCPKNEKSKKILKNYREITVDTNWYEHFQMEGYNPPDHNSHPNEPVSQYGCYLHSMYLINSILKKEISVKSDKPCGRLFQPVVELPSSLRPYLRVRGERMVEIDAESFHPHLIAYFIKDKCRRERYLDCVGKGIYEMFADSEYPRSKVKSSFQKFLAGKPTDSKSKQIRNWYDAEYPEVTIEMKKLKQQKTTFQMRLQQLESSIFVNKVFMISDFWSLPLHDGLAVLQEDVKKAKDLINAAFDKQLEYRIPLKTK